MTCAHGFERSPLRILRVTRGHPVPVRRQIAAGLASVILDGHLPPGHTLPSTRELARRLEVHRNTVGAAYRWLRDCGLVTLASGSPPRVAASKSAPPRRTHASRSRVASDPPITSRSPRKIGARDPPAVGLLRELANAAWESGLVRADLMAHLDEWRHGGTPPRLLLIEPDADLRSVLGAELRARACRRLVVSDLRAICARFDPESGTRADVRDHVRSGTIVLARPRIARRAAAALPHVSEIFDLELVGGSMALSLAMGIRLPGVVAVLTRSLRIRDFARHLGACHHATGLSVATPDPADPAALRRAIRIARLVLIDASCWTMSIETRAPVHRLHVLSVDTVRKLRRYLGDQMSGWM